MSNVYYDLNLPSKCKFYEGVDKVQIRTFKGSDEKLLAELSIANFNKKFSMILRNMLVGIEPEKLTLGDRQYIMVWLVINSISKTLPIQIECQECGVVHEHMVDFSRFEIKELPDDFIEPYYIQLSDDSQIPLRLLRVSDEIRANDLEKNGKNAYNYRWAMSIANETDLQSNCVFVEDLPMKDLMKIRKFHTEFSEGHGPDMIATTICPACGEEGRTFIPFQLGFLIPYGEILKKLV